MGDKPFDSNDLTEEQLKAARFGLEAMRETREAVIEKIAAREKFAALQEDSISDVTGVHSQKYFHRQLQVTASDVQRSMGTGGNSPHLAAVIVIDVAGLKAFNANYGMACGDAVIQKVADILKDFVRDNEDACRMGGDEFALIVNSANSNPEFMDKTIMRLNQKLQTEAVAEYDGNRFPLGFYITGKIIDGSMNGAQEYKAITEFLEEVKIAAKHNREQLNDTGKPVIHYYPYQKPGGQDPGSAPVL